WRQPPARPADRESRSRRTVAREKTKALADFFRLHLAPRHLVELRGDRVVARRTDAVAELRLGVIRDVAFDLLPVLVVAADPLAVTANREQPAKLFHVRERFLQL